MKPIAKIVDALKRTFFRGNREISDEQPIATLSRALMDGGGNVVLRADEIADLGFLNLDGDLYVGAFMASFTDERMVIGVSRDGTNWMLLNNGAPVYALPGYVVGSGANVVRDCSILYQSSTGYFYVAHTAGAYGGSGYFSVIRSKDLLNWSWVCNVSDTSGTPVDSGTSWGPELVEDTNGDIYAFVAASTSAGGTGIKIYRTKFNDKTDLSAGHSAFTLCTIPAGDVGHTQNEVNVFRKSDGTWIMEVNDMTSNVYKAYSAASLSGSWSSLSTSMGYLSVNEGIFTLEKPDGTMRTFTVLSAGRYKWYDFNAGLTATGSEQVQIVTSPDVAIQNGKAIRYRGPLAASLSTVSLIGTMALQNALAVAILGGTASGVAETAMKGVSLASGYAFSAPTHTSWANGGIIFRGSPDTAQAILGCATDNVLYLGLPAGGGGFKFYNSVRSVAVVTFTDSGAFSAGTLTIGGINGASGTTVTKIRHGTAVLVSGAVTVSDANVTANTRIFVNRLTDGGTVGDSYSITRSAGVNFTITSKAGGSTKTTDTSTVAYLMIEP